MKNNFKLILLVFVTFISISCNTKSQSKSDAKSGTISVVTPSEFKEKSLNQTVVDVRTPEEFNEGHIEGALNINLNDDAFSEQIAKLDKDKTVLVYCRSGKRSSAAANEMLKLGFQQIYDLDGGITNWIQSNNEIVK